MAAELADHADRMLVGDDVENVFQRDGLEIEAVARVEVGAYGLGIVVDDDRAVSVLAQRPDAVDARVIELDSLADADGSGPKDEDGVGHSKGLL